jgi:hypothetical protein
MIRVRLLTLLTGMLNARIGNVNGGLALSKEARGSQCQRNRQRYSAQQSQIHKLSFRIVETAHHSLQSPIDTITPFEQRFSRFVPGAASTLEG